MMKIPRHLLLMTFTMIIANVASFMSTPLLPLYLKSLGASAQEVGFFFTLDVILAICFRILGGWISDHIGRLPAIALGGSFGLLGYLGFAAAASWQWAIIGALLLQVGTSLVAPSFQAYTAENAPKGGESSTFGIVNGLFVICMIIGPLLGGFIAEEYGYKAMIWTATAIYGSATCIRLWLARHSRFEITHLHAARLVQDVRSVLVLFMGGGVMLWIFVIDGLSDSGVQLAVPFLPGFLTEIGRISESTFGGLYAFMSLIAAVAMLPGGMFADKYGEHRSFALGMGLMGVGWLGFALLPPQLEFFILTFALAGLAQAFTQPALSSLVSKVAPKESRGMVWGVFLTALGIMAVPAPYIGGILYEQVHPEATFIAAAVCVLLAVPLSLWKLNLEPVLSVTLPEAEPVL